MAHGRGANSYDLRQRTFAVCLGLACHLAFAAGVASMIAALYTGLRIGHGSLTGAVAVVANAALLMQFVVLHSLLLSPTGRGWIARLTPLGLGRDLATTTYALIASLQLVLTFWAWSPIGGVVWAAQGMARTVVTVAYVCSWLLLLKTMADAGLPVQTGSLGWTAVAQGRTPVFPSFRVHGTFRYVRQPVYVAFALTLWTGPVWTIDHLVIAVAWTLYCVLGPQLKERRYLRAYGAGFERYRRVVPYWIPAARPPDVTVLVEPRD